MSQFGNFIFGHEPTEEEAEEARIEEERLQMQQEDFANRMRRMLAEELTPEQLQVLHGIFASISRAGGGASGLSNWYEGMTHAASFTRDIRLAEKIVDLTED